MSPQPTADISARRLAVGISQAELARRAGIAPETMNRIEKGKQPPGVLMVAKIERALEEAENNPLAR